MPNPRNPNYVLGSIGQSLERLAKAWKSKVPPIQCLVVNKNTGLPGEGIGWFLVKKEDFAMLPLRQKRAIVEAELQYVFSYPRWIEILEALELEPTASDFTTFVNKATEADSVEARVKNTRLSESMSRKTQKSSALARIPQEAPPNI